MGRTRPIVECSEAYPRIPGDRWALLATVYEAHPTPPLIVGLQTTIQKYAAALSVLARPLSSLAIISSQ